MWKNVYFYLWIHQKGMKSLHREMEKMPSMQDSNGEENLSITPITGCLIETLEELDN
jgi:hypothetical protein